MVFVLLYSLVLLSILTITILLVKYIKYKEKYKIANLLLVFLLFNLLFFFDNLYASLKFSETLGIITTSSSYYIRNELLFTVCLKIALFFVNGMLIYFILTGHVEFIKRQEDKVKLMRIFKLSKKILLVDPDAEYLAKQKKILEEDGLSVLVASRGQDAITLLDAHNINIMVTEWKLPDMDGMVLCEHLRNRSKSARIILFTYVGLGPKEERFINNLRVKYYEKPMDFHDLAHLIESQIL
jgi:CheY-like chemotaxis protein